MYYKSFVHLQAVGDEPQELIHEESGNESSSVEDGSCNEKGKVSVLYFWFSIRLIPLISHACRRLRSRKRYKKRKTKPLTVPIYVMLCETTFMSQLKRSNF